MQPSETRAALAKRHDAEEHVDMLQSDSTRLSQILEDSHLTELIKRVLRAFNYGALRDVEVFVIARVVHLVGRVPSYHLKQVAQTAAMAVPGTHRIHNRLDVVRPTECLAGDFSNATPISPIRENADLKT